MKVITLVVLMMFFIISQQEELSICAYNVEIFGKTKMSNRTIAEILVKVFRRYDLSLIQEIRDASGEAIHELVEMINNCADCPQYGLELSEPLGRSNVKEQYGYIYKKSKIKILGNHQVY